MTAILRHASEPGVAPAPDQLENGELVFDDDGALYIKSSGDLLVCFGSAPTVPDRLLSGQSLVVKEHRQIRIFDTLTIDAGAAVHIEGTMVVSDV